MNPAGLPDDLQDAYERLVARADWCAGQLPEEERVEPFRSVWAMREAAREESAGRAA
jgi:hypothetical protein